MLFTNKDYLSLIWLLPLEGPQPSFVLRSQLRALHVLWWQVKDAVAVFIHSLFKISGNFNLWKYCKRKTFFMLIILLPTLTFTSHFHSFSTGWPYEVTIYSPNFMKIFNARPLHCYKSVWYSQIIKTHHLEKRKIFELQDEGQLLNFITGFFQ